MVEAVRRSYTDHSVEEVEGAQSDGVILVVETLQDEIFVRLHTLRVSL